MPGPPAQNKPEWSDFFAHLKEVFWPALQPEARIESRPDPPAGEPDVPDDIWQTAVMVFPDPEAWLHNPIPNQRMRSAVELIAVGKADVVRGILIEVAPMFLPDPSEVRAWDEG